MVFNGRAELRGVERVAGKNGDYLNFYFEELSGKPFNVITKNLDLARNVTKGNDYQIYVDVNFGRYKNVTLVDLELLED